MYKLLNRDGIYLSEEKGHVGENSKLKIFGKLDCPSANRWIKKGFYVEHRVFFADYKSALCGYRPCGVCLKEAYLAWKSGYDSLEVLGDF